MIKVLDFDSGVKVDGTKYGMMLVGFVTGCVYTQQSASLYWLEWEAPPDDGYLKIIKKPSVSGVDLSSSDYSLQGAKFLVVNADQSDAVQLVTGADGTVKSGALKPGYYAVWEVEPSKGFTLPAGTVKTVSVNGIPIASGVKIGDVQVKGTHTSASPLVVNVAEPPAKTRFRLKKESAVTADCILKNSNYDLTDGVFTLTGPAGSTNSKTYTLVYNSETGYYEVDEDLWTGDYELTEVSAPTGFSLPVPATWKVTLTLSGGTKTLN